MLMFYADEQLAHSIGSSELIKVKFEVDTNPPDCATFETKYSLLPISFEITLYNMPSLFAGDNTCGHIQNMGNSRKGKKYLRLCILSFQRDSCESDAYHSPTRTIRLFFRRKANHD